MASLPAYREAAGSRSGGKIVRARRVRSRNHPYERPGLSKLGPGGNPSWLSRFIFSPTLTIATGAGKLLSSVFVSDSSSSSSDSDSEDGVEDDVHDENRVFQGTEGVKKNGKSEMVNLFRKDFPPEKKDSKHLIEQLLMQETFSSSGELAVEQNHVDKIVEENDPSGHNHEAKGLALEERCELLSEVSMEVPNVNENDTDKVLSDGNDVGKVASEGNDNGKISEENGASKEKDGAGNVNKVEKPSSRSNVAAGKTSGTAYLRRGRQRN